PGLNRVVLFERHHDARAARHKFHKLAEEGALTMHGVKTFGHRPRHMQHLHCADFEAVVGDALNDGAYVARGPRVGLYDYEGHRGFIEHSSPRINQCEWSRE